MTSDEKKANAAGPSGPATARRSPQSRTVIVQRLPFIGDQDETLSRIVPIEAPVSIEVSGIGYAVMMATPSQLRDFALGFMLAEGLARRREDVDDIRIHRTPGGWIVRITLVQERASLALERARRRVSESSCGLCGIENIEQVLRPLPRITARIRVTRSAIAGALSMMQEHQPLNRATGAVHAAAFCAPDGRIRLVREDVGRHNALDKLIGALAIRRIDPAKGFILLSARCSYELVEKTVRAGCPMLVTVSAPTSLAVERAAEADLTLVTLARPDSALVICDKLANIAE
ncbi:MAG: formate dehydrogenase accessory sulfurtransferase FdhD [Xanthobacteraceae bacterium]